MVGSGPVVQGKPRLLEGPKAARLSSRAAFVRHGRARRKTKKVHGPAAFPENASFYGRVGWASSWGAGGVYEYRRQPPHCAVPTLDDRNAGRETVGTAATGVNR